MTIDFTQALDLFRAMPSVQAMKLARREPRVGLPALWQLIRVARYAGDYAEEHVLSDSFVAAACETRQWLGTAERLARRLVAQQPDRHHLRKLAMVLKLRGRVKEAASLVRRAKRVPDEHLTPEIEAAILEAEALSRKKA